MAKLPVLFISHGPPSVALREWPARGFLSRLGTAFPRPHAILCISAHWESVEPMTSRGEQPESIYDFAGPPLLHQIDYLLPGKPWLSKEVRTLLDLQGIRSKEVERGLDHGVWIPLMLMYPDGGVPTVQLSIQTEADADHHYRVGQGLSALRHAGVLILASGGAVHNLEEAREFTVDQEPPAHVRQFDRWLERQIIAGNTGHLLDFRNQAPALDRCHPYPCEHLLPLFVALGAADGASPRRLHESFLFGTLSMAAYAWE